MVSVAMLHLMTQASSLRRARRLLTPLMLFSCSLILLACAGINSFVSGDPIEASVHASGRPDADKARDADRRPEAILRFFEIEPGQRVADLMTGGGYYAELLARVVGTEGRVFAQNNNYVLKRFAEGPLSERLSSSELSNVTRIDSELENPELPMELDAVLMVLFYHDTFWMKVDRNQMNRAIFRALKPGGIFGVVDHRSLPGRGGRDAKRLHRGDAETIRNEILTTGFVLEAESDALHHPEDDLERPVFDMDLRGKTDRFVYRFRKPRDEE